MRDEEAVIEGCIGGDSVSHRGIPHCSLSSLHSSRAAMQHICKWCGWAAKQPDGEEDGRGEVTKREAGFGGASRKEWGWDWQIGEDKARARWDRDPLLPLITGLGRSGTSSASKSGRGRPITDGMPLHVHLVSFSHHTLHPHPPIIRHQPSSEMLSSGYHVCLPCIGASATKVLSKRGTS
jgi:hypothetical protein